MSYKNGAPDPFPLPASSGTYTPGIYAIIEWDDGELNQNVYQETLTAGGVANLSIPSDIFAPALETLLAAATAVTGLAAEQYVPVSGTYADDLFVAAAATLALLETFIGADLLTVALRSDGQLLEAGVYVEALAVPTTATPLMKAEQYVPQFGELLSLPATATPKLAAESVGEVEIVDTPDLEVTVRCYTLAVDSDLFPVDTRAKINALNLVVRV